MAASRANLSAPGPGRSFWLSNPGLRNCAIALLRPVFLAGGLVVWATLRLLRPWRLVRVGMLEYERIGHLALNTERYLRAGVRAGVLDVFVTGKPANEQLLAMIARRAVVLPSPWALRFYVHGLRPFIAGGQFELSIPFNGNEYHDLAKTGPQLSFTPEEEARGKAIERALGIPEGASFVCFHARDKAYLDAAHSYRGREVWSYHDYRDCAIENYLPAAEALAAKGLYALRMGSVVERPLERASSRVIDYATRHRSDFADVYLLARCKFMLGNTAGVACVPPIFNVPVALANFVPLGYSTWQERDLFIPKTYRDAAGRDVPFRRIVEMGATMWQESRRFADAGLTVVENTAEDILALAEEMDARLDGRWTPQPEDEELQRQYRALFPKDHPINGFPARVGAAFLRRYRALLN